LALGTFGNHHGVVHTPGRSLEARTAVMAALPELLLSAAEELGCRSVAMLYVGEPQAHDVDDAATRLGYQPTLLGAEAVHDLPVADWDGYLAGLSKRRRYQARKELRSYDSDGYRTVVRTGPEAFSEDLVGLQVAHRAKYGLPGGADRVRRDLDALRDDLGDSCVVLTAERGDEVASFTVYLRARDALFARTGGTLPDARGCYFAVDYHETVRWALQNGVRRIHYGMAAYEAKITRGCELRPRWGWFSFGGAQADTFREVLALQSKTMERQLELVGYPAPPLPSQFTLTTGSEA
jgi:predicted N-acyltransferase